MAPKDQRKISLRRLPHVFSQVLELPFQSSADVLIEEKPECFRFVAEYKGPVCGGQVRAHVVEIHPGVTKVVVVVGGGKNGEVVDRLMLDKLEVDVWRFRLPAVTQAELARAAVLGGQLVVTVPKRSQLNHVGDDRSRKDLHGVSDIRMITVQ